MTRNVKLDFLKTILVLAAQKDCIQISKTLLGCRRQAFMNFQETFPLKSALPIWLLQTFAVLPVRLSSGRPAFQHPLWLSSPWKLEWQLSAKAISAASWTTKPFSQEGSVSSAFIHELSQWIFTKPFLVVSLTDRALNDNKLKCLVQPHPSVLTVSLCPSDCALLVVILSRGLL